MDKISNILPKVLASHALEKSARSSLICEEFKRFFIKNWGEENLLDIASIKFKNGNLVVGLSNHVWSHQIFLRKLEFLSLMEKIFPNIKVVDVITKIT